MTDKEKYIVARWAYSVGHPIMSDAEYNVLDSSMKSLYPDWEYATRTWSDDPCPADLLRREGRDDLIKAIVLSDKTESIPSLNSWSAVRDTLTSILEEHECTISYKHDGWNVQVTYYNGELIDVSTRGRSTDAVNVNGLAAVLPQKIPVMGRVKVVGECTVDLDLFNEMKSKFNNALPRTAVSTALARADYITRLSFHAFDIIGFTTDNPFKVLMIWGFKVPSWDTVVSYDDLLQKIDTFGDNVANYKYPTDGLVVATQSFKRAIRVGYWEEPIYRSYITGYESSYGPYTISMKVTIRPVHTNKGMQYRLPITNLARIVSNNLRIGSPVAFKIISSANADIDEETTHYLQAQYEANYEHYREKIDMEETYRDIMAK